MLDQKDIEMFSAIVNTAVKEALKPVEARLDRLEKRMDSMEKRMDSMEGYIGAMEKRLTEKIDYVNEKVIQLHTQVRELRGDFKSSEWQIRKDIRRLQDVQDTIVVVLERHNLLPRAN